MKIVSELLLRGHVFLAGAAHLDRHARSDATMVPAASNPGTVCETHGGAIGNAATALSALGYELTLKSARGGDVGGERIAAVIDYLGIADLSTTWLDRSSPAYTAVLDERGELVAGIADMALYDLLRPRLFRSVHVRAAMAAADAFLIDANLPAATVIALTEKAGDRPVGAIGVSPAKVARLREAIPAISALFVSRAEACVLCEMPSDVPARILAHGLRDRGARRAVISDGPRPATILDGSRILVQLPPSVELRNAIGAGDTLAAVATALLAAGRPFEEAARGGIAAAAVRVSAARFPPDDFALHLAGMYERMADASDEGDPP